MGGAFKKPTVGYKYYLGMHLAICHGPVDAVTEIQAGERQAWAGNCSASGRIDINAPKLFGGDDREGGVVGAVDAAFGTSDQAANDYLTARLGTPQPAYRGVLGLILRKVHITSNNPYIKPWAVRVKRCPRAWYPAKAEIAGGANPAHMIQECLTNPVWGMGYPDISIDSASFTAAADTLYTEGFGLNLIWMQQQTIEAFVREVLDHCGGVLTASPTTGRFELRLIRADYDPETLPVLDPGNVIELESYQRAAWGETINEVVVVYTQASTGKDTSVTVQDPANIQVQGAVVSQTRRYPGIADDTLASRVAMRDLQTVSTPLAKVRLRVNRAAWAFTPGDVFRLDWPPLGIEGLVLRIGEIDTGTLTQGEISLEAVEDVFGMPSASYATPPPIGWEDPVPEPTAATPRRLVEAPYWDIARALSAADLAMLDPTSGYLEALGGRPSSGAFRYELHTKSSSASTYEDRGQGDFCPHAALVADLPVAVQSTISYAGEVDPDLVEAGTYAYIDDEAVAVTAIDLATRTLVLDRGVLDTLPAAHAAGAIIWFADGYQGVDETEYATGETVNARMLTTTGKGTLDLAAAPTDNLTMVGRQFRPYPPGDFKVNGSRYPAFIAGQSVLSLTWAHRDRLSQTLTLVAQTQASIGPEAGTTYSVRVYDVDEGSVPIKQVSGISGASWSYTDEGELTADQPDPNVASLLHFDGADGSTTFTDEVSGVTWGSPSYATISNLQSRFGGTSLRLTNSYDSRIQLTGGGQLIPTNTTPFTIECWVYLTGTPGPWGHVIFSQSCGGGGCEQCFSISSSGILFFNRSANVPGGSLSVQSAVGAVATNAWVCVAVTFDGSKVRLFVGGLKVAEGSTAYGWGNTSATQYIGHVFVSGYPGYRSSLVGYIDDFRITKACRYTADYAVPTLPGGFSPGVLHQILRIELESVRGGLTSLQKYNHTLRRAGYGFNYGYTYGGI